jgi:hypothetical protein
MQISSFAPHQPATNRLAPSKTFAEASALVEEALNELRAAEIALERQLSDLRGYMRDSRVDATSVQ